MIEYKLADVRFNSGVGALLCNRCRIILDYGFEHKDKLHYCKECLRAKVIDYVIEPSKDGTNYVLYSIVDTDFGGDAKNYITEGPLHHVEGTQTKLALDELARIGQELGLE